MPEDLPMIETLNLTMVKYTEAIKYLDRQTPPEFLQGEYGITGCKISEMESLAAELGLQVWYHSGTGILEITKERYVLRLWGQVFKG